MPMVWRAGYPFPDSTSHEPRDKGTNVCNRLRRTTQWFCFLVRTQMLFVQFTILYRRRFYRKNLEPLTLYFRLCIIPFNANTSINIERHQRPRFPHACPNTMPSFHGIYTGTHKTLELRTCDRKKKLVGRYQKR